MGLFQPKKIELVKVPVSPTDAMKQYVAYQKQVEIDKQLSQDNQESSLIQGAIPYTTLRLPYTTFPSALLAAPIPETVVKKTNANYLAQQAIDTRLLEIYKAISEGQTVVNIEDSIRMAGCNEKDLPRLAIAKAHWRALHAIHKVYGTVSFSNAADTTTFMYDMDKIKDTKEGDTIVPVIPASIRPEKPEDFVIVWEPVWRYDSPRSISPFLLRPLGGMLYSFVSTWDVSPVEQAILRGL